MDLQRRASVPDPTLFDVHLSIHCAVCGMQGIPVNASHCPNCYAGNGWAQLLVSQLLRLR